MSVKVINIKGDNQGETKLDKLLVKNIHKQCMFEQVIAEDAGKRQATVSTKTRAEVRGGGRKPRPQKGTGRAQLGSTRASHCVGGGNAFGPKPNRNYKLYLNDKQSHLAFRSAITLKEKDNSIIVLKDSKLDKPNTKSIVSLLKGLKLYGKKVLFITNNNVNLNNSAKNINKVVAKSFNSVSTKDVLNSSVVIIEESSIDKLNTLYKI